MPLQESELTRLVREAQRGDQAAYQALVLRFMHQVFIVAYNILYDYHQTEDITQETFLKAWSALKTLRQPEKFSQWLLEITRNLALDWLKTKGKKEAVPLSSLPEQVDKKIHGSRLSQTTERILDEIGKLSVDYQEIMIMRHVNNLSYKEIARRLEMTVSAVGEKLWRIRQLLRQRLRPKTIENNRG